MSEASTSISQNCNTKVFGNLLMNFILARNFNFNNKYCKTCLNKICFKCIASILNFDEITYNDNEEESMKGICLACEKIICIQCFYEIYKIT